jgi:hypothetical protein
MINEPRMQQARIKALDASIWLKPITSGGAVTSQRPFCCSYTGLPYWEIPPEPLIICANGNEMVLSELVHAKLDGIAHCADDDDFRIVEADPVGKDTQGLNRASAARSCSPLWSRPPTRRRLRALASMLSAAAARALRSRAAVASGKPAFDPCFHGRARPGAVAGDRAGERAALAHGGQRTREIVLVDQLGDIGHHAAIAVAVLAQFAANEPECAGGAGRIFR